MNFASLAAAGLARGVDDSADDVAKRAWAATLPARLEALHGRWSIDTLVPLAHGGTGSWIGACTLRDGTEGILKLAFPHLEGRDEIAGLEACDGEPTVRLLRADRALDAMLLERLRPGHALSIMPEPAQDIVVGDLLQRFGRVRVAPGVLRPLAGLIALWRDMTLDRRDDDARGPAVVASGLAAFDALLTTTAGTRPLATDLHAGNVLSREVVQRLR